MQRIITSTALVFAGALLLSGCATAGGGDTDAAPTANLCDTVASGVRDISNGVQNNLAAAADRTVLDEYLSSAADRIDAFVEEASENEELVAAVEDFKAEVAEANDYAAQLPEPDEEGTVEQDPDQLGERQAALQEAAAKVGEACDGE